MTQVLGEIASASISALVSSLLLAALLAWRSTHGRVHIRYRTALRIELDTMLRILGVYVVALAALPAAGALSSRTGAVIEVAFSVVSLGLMVAWWFVHRQRIVAVMARHSIPVAREDATRLTWSVALWYLGSVAIVSATIRLAATASRA